MLDQILIFINSIYSIPDLIGWGGYLILFLIVFAETGLLVGFFLPGDSLLIISGIFAGAGKLDILLLNFLLVPAAIIGDSTGYWFGNKLGRRLFQKENSRLFRKKRLLKAKSFYERHGGKTIILARFMPVLRTFAPIVAGAAEMPYKRFLVFNIVGGILWVTGMLSIGYFIVPLVPNIQEHIGILVITIVLLSFLPALIGYLIEKRRKKTHVDLSEAPVPA